MNQSLEVLVMTIFCRDHWLFWNRHCPGFGRRLICLIVSSLADTPSALRDPANSCVPQMVRERYLSLFTTSPLGTYLLEAAVCHLVQCIAVELMLWLQMDVGVDQDTDTWVEGTLARLRGQAEHVLDQERGSSA